MPRRTANSRPAFWKSIKDSTLAADFEAYLAKYPNGEFVAVARNRLSSLKPAQLAALSPARAKSTPDLDVDSTMT